MVKNAVGIILRLLLELAKKVKKQPKRHRSLQVSASRENTTSVLKSVHSNDELLKEPSLYLIYQQSISG